MSKKSQKLVRDNIPEIIKLDGLTPITRVLGDEEYLQELISKLREEIEEFEETPNIEELADIVEVAMAMRQLLNISEQDLEDTRKAKAIKNGAFKNRIYLEDLK